MTSRLEGTVDAPGEAAVKTAYQRAHERAEMLQGLYIHLMVYAVVNLGLFLINAFTRGEDGGWWFVWPLGAWGVGLLLHVIVTLTPVFSPDWADQRAERMLEESERRW